MKNNSFNIIALIVIQFLLTLFCFIFLTIDFEENKKEQNTKIECLEKQIEEYQARCERLIDTNLDIFLNHRFEEGKE